MHSHLNVEMEFKIIILEDSYITVHHFLILFLCFITRNTRHYTVLLSCVVEYSNDSDGVTNKTTDVFSPMLSLHN